MVSADKGEVKLVADAGFVCIASAMSAVRFFQLRLADFLYDSSG